MAKVKKNITNDKRNNRKAWGKNHEPKVKVLTLEQEAHKAHKDAERARRKNVAQVRGLNVTPPSITWEWMGEMMYRRWPDTHKVRVMDRYLALQKGKPE